MNLQQCNMAEHDSEVEDHNDWVATSWIYFYALLNTVNPQAAMNEAFMYFDYCDSLFEKQTVIQDDGEG